MRSTGADTEALRGTLAKVLFALQRRLVAVARRVDDLLTELDAIAKMVEDLRADFPVDAWVDPPPVRRPPHVMRLLAAEAAAGVSSVRFVPLAHGSFEVSVNGRDAIRLSTQLGATLAALAAPGRRPADGLVGWKTKRELAAAIRERTGGDEEPDDVPKIVHRLRKAFEAAGENPELIRSKRGMGFRFALRAPEPDGGRVIEGEA